MRRLIGAAAALALSVSAARGTEPVPFLGVPDCDFIRAYDARRDVPSFIDQFLHMAHTSELQMDHASGSYRANGPTRLMKWAEVINIYYQLSSHTCCQDLVIENTDYALSFAQKHSDIKINIEEDLISPAMVIFIGEFTGVDYEGYKKIFNGNKDFDDFIINRQRCIAIVYTRTLESHEISDVDIWIDSTDLTERQLATCIKEEIFNAMGLLNDPQGDPSLFHDRLSRTPIDEHLYFDGHGDRDRIMLRLLYHDDLKIGDSADTTRANLERIISRDCKINY